MGGFDIMVMMVLIFLSVSFLAAICVIAFIESIPQGGGGKKVPKKLDEDILQNLDSGVVLSVDTMSRPIDSEERLQEVLMELKEVAAKQDYWVRVTNKECLTWYWLAPRPSSPDSFENGIPTLVELALLSVWVTKENPASLALLLNKKVVGIAVLDRYLKSRKQLELESLVNSSELVLNV